LLRQDRRRAWHTAGYITLAALVSAPLSAAAAEADAPDPSAAEVQEVVVTAGSRIAKAGYEAPTPVTVTAAPELLKAAPESLFEGLKEQPQFANSSTSINTTHQNINSVPGTTLNLRNLGPTRTLVLMDGWRLPSTYRDGTVDVDVVPQMLVSRVEVVTAGASAAYGSDAVAGVVNFVLDSRFTGGKVNLQGGISDRGDYENYRFGLAYGADLGERTHLLLSAERYENKGFRANERPQYFRNGLSVGSVVGSTAAAGSAANPKVTAFDTVWTTLPTAGIATSGPFSGAVFLGGGQYRLPPRTGNPTGSPGIFVVPGGIFNSDLITSQAPWTQAPHVTNSVGFARLEHDFGGGVTAYAQATLAEFEFANTAKNSFTQNTRFFSGNPYLPGDLQARLTSTNTASFTYSKYWGDAGVQHSSTDMFHYNIRAGVKGDLGRFKWDVAYQHGRSDLDVSYGPQFIATRFAAASDAVRDPATGNIVCNVLLNPDPAVRARYAGCVPIDPFGPNSISRAAAEYVNGTSTYDSKNGSDIISVSLSGDAFDLWAGPVSVAVGAEYRKDKLDIDSNSDPSKLGDITGLRALTTAPAMFFFNNVAVAHGSVDVKEAFAEVAVPLAKDLPFLQSLDVNGAARVTDYSTSGTVTTWKAGFVWSPIEDVRLRLTRSRDIRAPSLQELFLGTNVNLNGFMDPHTRVANLTTVITGGNPNLEPEKADTLTYGIVVQPRFLPGFDVSVDYYDINLKDAISTLSTATIAAGCEASGGTGPLCDLIVRPLPFSNTTPANYPTSIRTVPVNIASLRTRGVDIEASYRRDIGPGAFSARLVASHLLDYKSKDSPLAGAVEYAGKTDRFFLPKWRGSLSLNYEVGDLSVFVQEQYIGKVSYGPTFVYRDPDIDPVFYTHVTVSYALELAGRESEVFLNVHNLFDKDAPLYTADSPSPGSILDTQPRVYDVVGRTFTAGVRLRF